MFNRSNLGTVYARKLKFGMLLQGSHRLEKYLKMKGSLEKSLKTKFVLKSP